MWPNSALAQILRDEARGTEIEYTMDSYVSYLSQLGLNSDKWTLEHIAMHLDKPDREVGDLLEAMLTTDWAREFDLMHGYLTEYYGPELADLFNPYNFLALTR